MFLSVTGFLASLATLAGHEMIHYKDPIDKFVGGLPFNMSFYSHWPDEHVRGHHKLVSTRDDPIFAPVGTSPFIGVFKSIIGTHTNSWARDAERIKRKDPNLALSA